MDEDIKGLETIQAWLNLLSPEELFEVYELIALKDEEIEDV